MSVRNGPWRRFAVVDVALTTPAPTWPWRRQLPGGGDHWGPLRFLIDQPVDRADAWVVFEALAQPITIACPPDRLIFITGEPPDIGRYHPGFLAQFAQVVTCHDGLDHPNVLRLQQGHPWFVEKSYDALLAMAPMAKDADVCVTISNKAFTPGHRRRLEFVEALKARLGDRLDIYGRGIRDFDSKWSLLSRYRYSIVLENCEQDDWLTEKLPDAWLAYCFPFYSGCPNLGRYVSDGGQEILSMQDFSASIERVVRCLDDADHYQRHLAQVAAVRERYLRELQFFPNAAALVQVAIGQSSRAARPVTLLPNAHFAPRPRRGMRALARQVAVACGIWPAAGREKGRME